MQHQTIIRESQRCVKCAYCLPHCPSYRLLAQEADSPRGRIELMGGLAAGELQGTLANLHLDRCLGCRSCEHVCPSGVAYEQLLSASRALQRQSPGNLHRWAGDRLRRLLTQPPFALLWAASALHRPLRWATGKLSPRLGRLLGEEPPGPCRWLPSYLPNQPPVGRIGLFTGCISRVIDHRALEDTIILLTRLGYEVVVPRQQSCCGAMDRGAGDLAQAQTLMEQNRRLFDGLGLEGLVYVASGCGARLSEYEPPLATPVVEICRFLVNTPAFYHLPFRPLSTRVALHTPCSLKNVLADAGAPMTAIGRIPGLVPQALSDNGLCCGGAGLFLLTQPVLADQLIADKVSAAQRDAPQLLLTTNSGCALSLRTALRQAGIALPVLHPVSLLAAQLESE